MWHLGFHFAAFREFPALSSARTSPRSRRSQLSSVYRSTMVVSEVIMSFLPPLHSSLHYSLHSSLLFSPLFSPLLYSPRFDLLVSATRLATLLFTGILFARRTEHQQTSARSCPSSPRFAATLRSPGPNSTAARPTLAVRTCAPISRPTCLSVSADLVSHR